MRTDAMLKPAGSGMACPTCHGAKTVPVERKDPATGAMRIERVPCPKCGGAGVTGQRGGYVTK
jgi:DnaJ-class molecular chaperone